MKTLGLTILGNKIGEHGRYNKGHFYFNAFTCLSQKGFLMLSYCRVFLQQDKPFYANVNHAHFSQLEIHLHVYQFIRPPVVFP